METTLKKPSIKQRASKAIVTQDNRFIYAKYDMNANEMKFFMWIVAHLNSQRESLFKICEIPLSEIMQVWQWSDTGKGYTYVKELVSNMSKKTYIEDFKLLNEKTMKEINVFRAMPLFKFIEYKQGQSHITYQLNDCLMEYLLNLKRDFTQLKFSDIQKMKSAYSIRIYNMLICELKQNRQNLKINLEVLQNILEVPKTLQEYKHFNQKVLAQAKKDINSKSNLVLLEINTFKTGRKITELEFVFDYKNNDKRIQRDQEKKKSYNKVLLEALESYIGKSIYLKDYGELVCIGRKWDENMQNVYIVCRQVEREKEYVFRIREFKDIKTLQKHKDRAEELFYLNTEKTKQAFDFRKQLEQGGLFDNIHKKI